MKTIKTSNNVFTNALTLDNIIIATLSIILILVIVWKVLQSTDCGEGYELERRRRLYDYPSAERKSNPKDISSTDKQLSHIVDHIYLGNWYDSISEQKLKCNNIKFILTLNGKNENIHTDQNILMFQRLGIITKRIDIDDHPSANIVQYVPQSLDFIKKAAPRNILVHCTAGVSRSASIVIAYLMKCRQMPYDSAFGYVKGHRRIINPNYAFKQQLRRL